MNVPTTSSNARPLTSVFPATGSAMAATTVAISPMRRNAVRNSNNVYPATICHPATRCA